MVDSGYIHHGPRLRNRVVAPPDDLVEDEDELFEDDELDDEGFPIRLRHLIVLLLCGGGVWIAYPRAMAAWALHDSATKLADYALCMAGPTGPSLIRDNPPEFKRLLRRRLLAAHPGDRPFETCAVLGKELTKSEAVESVHQSQAWSFVEYGGDAADALKTTGERGMTLDDLKVSVKPLAKLAKEGWPFVRGGYSRLIKPSSTAKGAPHPSELPRPAIGQGLPAWRVRYRAVKVNAENDFTLAMGAAANLAVYRTRDGGISWKPAAINDSALSSFAERCPTPGGRSYTIGFDDGGKYWVVSSQGPDIEPYSSRFAYAKEQLVSAACDDDAIVIATRKEKSSDVSVAYCEYRQVCRAFELPEFGPQGQKPRYPIDLARINGTTVLATARHGVLRVASSRDAGKSWTPFVVAFDIEASGVPTAIKVPSRLLALGEDLMLYGGAPKPGMTYPVLISKDGGASWGASPRAGSALRASAGAALP
ncbi:MAG: sialidase family protein [Polyangiaceae bacterium]